MYTFYKPQKNIVHGLNPSQLPGEAPYPDVTYHLTLRRRPLFYGFHFFFQILIPWDLLAC